MSLRSFDLRSRVGVSSRLFCDVLRPPEGGFAWDRVARDKRLMWYRVRLGGLVMSVVLNRSRCSMQYRIGVSASLKTASGRWDTLACAKLRGPLSMYRLGSAAVAVADVIFLC